MRKIPLLAVMALVMSCGSDSSSVSVGNQNPLGTVGGIVLDGASEMPLSGAMVSLLVGGQAYTATTDMNGVFKVVKVPSGNFLATITNTMYETVIINGALNGAVGNFPIKDPVATLGPIGLIKNDGTFSFKLEDETGAAVAMVAVTAQTQVRWIDFSNGFPSAQGSYTVTATSGTDGTVMLAGLPEYSALSSEIVSDAVTIDVPPQQVMGAAGVYSFLGGSFTFNVNHLSSQGSAIDQAIIKLAGPTTFLQVLNSNVDMLRGLSGTGAPFPNVTSPSYGTISVIPYIPPTGPVTIEFNQVINKSTIRAQLFNEDGTTAGQMMATGTGNELSLAPAAALTAGNRYNMALHVDAAVVPGQQSIAREMDVMVPLFIQPASGTMLKISTTVPPKSIYVNNVPPFNVIFSFNTPVGFGFGSTAGIPCVSYLDIPSALGLDNGETTTINGVPTMNYPGEWPMGSSTGVGVTCNAQSTLDVTKITPLETATGMPNTGFASKWQITIDDPGHTECKYTAPCTGVLTSMCCPLPSPYPTVHLLPSHASAGSTIKFPDGTTVPDNVTNLSFPVPGP